MTEIRHLFLDLEDTVITPVTTTWYDTYCINIETVKNWIDLYEPDYISLFSFALHNQKELKDFNKWTRPMLEVALGRRLTFTWTMDDMIIPMCCAEKGVHKHRTSFEDVVTFWGKQDAFRMCMRHFFAAQPKDTFTNVTLFDDMVFNETFAWDDIRVTGKIVNIMDLEEKNE